MFEKLDNFRDFGGRPAAGGHVVAGRLFRSAHHVELSDSDLAALHQLGISVLVDLRQPSERRRYPSRRPPEFCAKVIETDVEHPDGDRWIGFLRSEPELTADAFRDYIRRFYRQAPYDPALTEVFARYFHALAETEGAVLVHCMAGKDRTGVLVGLTQRLLGVPDEYIFRDYAASALPDAIERRVGGLCAFVAEHVGRELAPDCARAALGAEAEYLRLAFDELERQHGSVERYLEEVLGVDSAHRDEIRTRLVREA